MPIHVNSRCRDLYASIGGFSNRLRSASEGHDRAIVIHIAFSAKHVNAGDARDSIDNFGYNFIAPSLREIGDAFNYFRQRTP